MEIALLHKVAVDQGQSADSGARQQGSRGGSRSSTAHHRDVGSGQALLPPLPDSRIKHLARVTLFNRFHCALP